MSAAPLIADSRIIEATVFSDAAHVVRRARAELSEGLNRVALPDLPRSLDPARLRVATSAGRVCFVETDDLAWKDGPQEDSDREAEMKAASKKVHRLRGEHSALQAELRLIDRVLPGRDREAPLDRLRPAAFLQGLEALTKRRRDTLYAIRVAEYELALAEQALADARAFAHAAGRTELLGPRAAIVVGVETAAAGPAELDLTYTSGWATWRPYYSLRLGRDVSSVELATFADVWQETGEDWPDVRLALSTAEPEEQLVLPQIDPWILALRRSYEDDNKALYAERRSSAPAPKRAAAPPMHGPAPMAPPPMPAASMAAFDAPSEVLEAPTGDLMADYAAQYEEEGIFSEITSSGLAASGGGGPPGGFGGPPEVQSSLPPPPPPPAKPSLPSGAGRRPSPDHPDLPRLLEHAPPRAASGGIDFVLEVPTDKSCPSGKSHQRIGIERTRYETEVRYLLRPGLKDHAFGQVTVTHDGEAPLLTGPAALFVDDAFFGNTRILTTPAGGKLVLDLGAETDIKSARRSRTSVRTEGLINKEDVHLVEVTIEIESFKDRPVQLEVQDQIPVSADRDVKVRLLETKPAAKLDEKTGVLTFEMSAPPRERLTLTVRYEIEAPKDYQLVRNIEASS